MKKIIMILIIMLLAACARTSATLTDPDTGHVFKVKTFTLGKDIKDAHLDTSDGLKFDLGGSNISPQNTAIACALAPHLCRGN